MMDGVTVGSAKGIIVGLEADGDSVGNLEGNKVGNEVDGWNGWFPEHTVRIPF